MTITIDRRLLALFVCVLALHIASFWTNIHRFFASVHKAPEFRDDAASMTITAETLDAWKAAQQTAAKQQIVQTDHTGRNEKPKDSAFLGEKDMSFDRQTIARKVDVFNKAGKGVATADESKAAVAKQQKTERKALDEALKNLKLSDLGTIAAAQPLPERRPATGGKKGIASGDERNSGVSSTNDYVEHVGLGDFTQMNTVEYKHYGFFHRIRQKLEQFWGQSLKEKADALYKSGRRLPASDQYTTSLMITLDPEGQIVKVQVKSSSGVRELDDAATESFNKAGPFPNPPSDLLVNGRATIEWGFVVQS